MLALEKIKHIISQYHPIELATTPQSAAVMLLILTDESNLMEIVITKRAMNLPTYAGHYSFPGGMRDPEDSDLYTTATRELQEELHIRPDSYEFVGQLDDFHDRYGHLVRPFVITMHKKIFIDQLGISAEEITSVYYLSIANLPAMKDDPNLHAITKRRPSYVYHEGEIFIWGLTAAILIHFGKILQIL